MAVLSPVLVLLAARRPRQEAQSGGIRTESNVLRAAPFRPRRLVSAPHVLTRRPTASAVGYWLARFARKHFVDCHYLSIVTKRRRRLYLRFFRRRTLEELNREFFVIALVGSNQTIVSY